MCGGRYGESRGMIGIVFIQCSYHNTSYIYISSYVSWMEGMEKVAHDIIELSLEFERVKITHVVLNLDLKKKNNLWKTLSASWHQFRVYFPSYGDGIFEQHLTRQANSIQYKPYSVDTFADIYSNRWWCLSDYQINLYCSINTET